MTPALGFPPAADVRATEVLAAEPRWSLEDVLRVLYHVVTRYVQAVEEMGGDSEFLRDAMRIGCQTLHDNNWWPTSKPAPRWLMRKQ